MAGAAAWFACCCCEFLWYFWNDTDSTEDECTCTELDSELIKDDGRNSATNVKFKRPRDNHQLNYDALGVKELGCPNSHSDDYVYANLLDEDFHVDYHTVNLPNDTDTCEQKINGPGKGF